MITNPFVIEAVKDAIRDDVVCGGKPSAISEAMLFRDIIGYRPQAIASRLHKTLSATMVQLDAIDVIIGTVRITEVRANRNWVANAVSAFIRRSIGSCNEFVRGWLVGVRDGLACALSRPRPLNTTASRVDALLSDIPRACDVPGLYAFGYPSIPGRFKIGMSAKGVRSRLVGEFARAERTVMPEDPVVYRLWASDDAAADECRVHRVLDGDGLRHRGIVSGREWYDVSADRLDDVMASLGIREVWRRGDGPCAASVDIPAAVHV